jgi:hypothetical protein
LDCLLAGQICPRCNRLIARRCVECSSRLCCQLLCTSFCPSRNISLSLRSCCCDFTSTINTHRRSSLFCGGDIFSYLSRIIPCWHGNSFTRGSQIACSFCGDIALYFLSINPCRITT